MSLGREIVAFSGTGQNIPALHPRSFEESDALNPKSRRRRREAKAFALLAFDRVETRAFAGAIWGVQGALGPLGRMASCFSQGSSCLNSGVLTCKSRPS